MATNISGRCLCGFVSWEYTGTVGPANYCHCADCRRATGSAFNVGVRLDSPEFRISSGVPASFTKRAESGRELTRSFCPECGSPIFTSSPAHPDQVYVKAGSFDDPTVVRPTRESWTASAVSWSRIAEGLLRFEKGPGPV